MSKKKSIPEVSVDQSQSGRILVCVKNLNVDITIDNEGVGVELLNTENDEIESISLDY